MISLQSRRPIVIGIIIVFIGVAVVLPGAVCMSVEVTTKLTIVDGTSANLECRWSLEPSEQIYSVKWYQGLNEIYRYTPSKYPNSIQLFKNNFLTVDRGGSDKGNIRLLNVTIGASGYFRCEVSGEAPSFYTVYGTVNVTIVSPPDGNPYISGHTLQYEVGDYVDLSCVSTEAKPVPRLTFFVNDKKALENWVGLQVFHAGMHGLKKTSLRLRFTLKKHMVDHKGMVRIKCVAVIPEVYKGLANISLNTGGLLPASAYGAKATVISHPGRCLPTLLLIFVFCLNPISLSY